MNNFNKLLTVNEVCQALSIGKTTGYKLLREKSIPSGKIGNKILVRETDLQNYINEHLNATPPEHHPHKIIFHAMEHDCS